MLWSKKQETWRVKGLGQNCVLLAASKPQEILVTESYAAAFAGTRLPLTQSFQEVQGESEE